MFVSQRLVALAMEHVRDGSRCISLELLIFEFKSHCYRLQ